MSRLIKMLINRNFNNGKTIMDTQRAVFYIIHYRVIVNLNAKHQMARAIELNEA